MLEGRHPLSGSRHLLLSQTEADASHDGQQKKNRARFGHGGRRQGERDIVEEEVAIAVEQKCEIPARG